MTTTQALYARAGKTDAYLDEGMRGFIFNTAKKEFWKVASYYEFDDLVSDGYVCFYKCRKRLHERLLVNNPTKDQRREVQAFVARAFFNHISTLATKRMGVHEMPEASLSTDDDQNVFEELLPPQMEEATLLTLLASAPAELKQLIQLLVSDGLSLLKFERKRVGRRLVRETSNEFYCRLLGVDPEKNNLVEQLRAYFQ